MSSPEFVSGFNTFDALAKKALKNPSWAGFMEPGVFAASFGWFQTKAKRGYSSQQAEQFLRGFQAACRIWQAVAATHCPKCKVETSSCVTPKGRPTSYHKARRKALEGRLRREEAAAGGVNP